MTNDTRPDPWIVYRQRPPRNGCLPSWEQMFALDDRADCARAAELLFHDGNTMGVIVMRASQWYLQYPLGNYLPKPELTEATP